MTEITKLTRPDVDVEEDIIDVTAHYPPLQADRHQLRTEVRAGEVILSGHVKSLVSRRYLLDHVAQVSGVKSVDSARLYCEETIRIEAGQRIPKGVIANAVYGTVILTGTLPVGTTAEDTIKAVALIPGVERVVTKF